MAQGELLLIYTKNTPQQIYEFYKCRAAVEILFDTFKNILFADVTYTRSN